MADKFNHDAALDAVTQFMQWDIGSYLPDDILTKVDRASMSVSLETRAPFLDHRVMQYAMSISPTEKIKHGRGKQHLRQMLYKRVPSKLIDRPKTGFGIPLDDWLRNGLKEWGSDLLNSKACKQSQIIDNKFVERLWHDHQSGQKNNQQLLWSLFMFLQWQVDNGHQL